MTPRCYFVPSYILNHIARVEARESLEPSAVQRSAVVSAQFRRARRYQSPTVGAAAPIIAANDLDHVPPGLTVPPLGSGSRLIFDDQHQWTENVRFVRGEGDPAVSGENANRAYDYLGLVRKYYKEKLGRNSIDNNGLNIVGNVNFGTGFDNAFWDASTFVMVFGNGSTYFKDLTGDIDVSGHELTHGVTQFSAGLNYTPDQSGALNESFSDMIGTAIDAWANNRTEETHNWLIGEDIMANQFYGEALRNLAEPGTAFDNPILGRDQQPRDMRGYFEPADPHLMSGIPNRWYFLVCQEIGLDAGTLIMYQTLQNLWPDATFNDAALVAAAQARILAEAKQVPSEAAQVVRAMARQQGFW